MTPRTHYYGPASSVVWVILFFSLCKPTNTGRTLLENRPASLHSFLRVRWSHYSTLLFMERSVMVLWELLHTFGMNGWRVECVSGILCGCYQNSYRRNCENYFLVWPRRSWTFVEGCQWWALIKGSLSIVHIQENETETLTSLLGF